MATIGVLALQGAFREHVEALTALGADVVPIRRVEQLEGLDAIVLPGGESTTQSKLLDAFDLRDPLVDALRAGLPCFATCAGMILLATEVLDGRADQVPLGLLDVAVRRNGYGRQVMSFEAALDVDGLAEPFTGVFIRAPLVERVGADVEVLATHRGAPVLVRRERIWAAGFHPELTDDRRLHQLFLNDLIREGASA